jgi:hypothetical protein
MRRVILISVGIAISFGIAGKVASAQTTDPAPAIPAPALSASAQPIDGIAARIEDDVLTESQLRELAAFQKLVDGQAKPRADLIRELGDQWAVRNEAIAARYPEPSSDEVDHAYQQLAARFSSSEDFKNRCEAAGLTETDVRRMLGQQLYLTRFLDYRFRPAVQVEQKEIEAYYNGEFASQLKSRGQSVPPLQDVEDSIREVLVQRAISDRANEWLDETRARLKIDIVAEKDRP